MIIFSSCSNSLIKGTWQYDGGVYNGRSQKASPEFQMKRKYSANSYEAYMLEGNNPPDLYNSGIYEIKGDTPHDTPYIMKFRVDFLGTCLKLYQLLKKREIRHMTQKALFDPF